MSARLPALAATLAATLAIALAAPLQAGAQDGPDHDRDAAEAVISAHPGDRAQAAISRAGDAAGDFSLDADAALASLDRILADPGLDADLRIKALIAHSVLAAVRKNDNAAAVADMDKAIALAPRIDLISLRGSYYDDMGRPTEATADFDRVLAARPDDQATLRLRGLSYLRQARWADAAADLSRTLAAKPDIPYAVLELHLARLNLKQDDHEELARTAAAAGAGETWPSPLFAYFQGRLTLDQVLATAAKPGDQVNTANDTPQSAPQRLCEARYYMGAALTAQGQLAAGRPLLQQAADSCPLNYAEHTDALADLARLGAAPKP